MKKLFGLLFLISMLVVTVTSTSCTDQQRAKKWGGNMSYDITPGEHFVNATWKDADLWIITQNDATGVYYMQESSNWGILEGKVTINDPSTYKRPAEPDQTKPIVNDPNAPSLPPGNIK